MVEIIVIGKHRWSLEMQFSANTIVGHFPTTLRRADNSCVGGISTLLAPDPRRVAEGILSTDEKIDGKDFGYCD